MIQGPDADPVVAPVESSDFGWMSRLFVHAHARRADFDHLCVTPRLAIDPVVAKTAVERITANPGDSSPTDQLQHSLVATRDSLNENGRVRGPW